MDPETSVTYELTAIPDATDRQLQRLGHADIYAGIQSGVRHLLGLLAQMPAGVAAVSLLFLFTPCSDAALLQHRLRLYAVVRSNDAEARKSLCLLLERGALARYYPVAVADETPVLPWPAWSYACDVVRKELAIAPSCPTARNWRIPAALYDAPSLIPNPDCDYLAVDRVLDGLDQSVALHLSAEPLDATAARVALARYDAHLQGVNRPDWNDRVEENPDYFGDSSRSRRSDGTFRLPQDRDPLVDAVHRNVQERRPGLHEPQLFVHFRVLADTPATARLLASTAAECAFEKGSYGLVLTRSGEPRFGECLEGVRTHRPTAPLTTGAAIQAQEPRLYAGFEHLANTVSPEEFLGAFRFPIGSYVSPYCGRQHTDPLCYPLSDLIVLGVDAVDGIPTRNSPLVGMLATSGKYGAIFTGGPGSGKTTAEVAVILQLFERRVPFVHYAPLAGEELAIKRNVCHLDPNIRELARHLAVFTPGRPDISPMGFNPFVRFPWVPLDQHISGLHECFLGALSFIPAMEGILKDALYLLYRRFPDPQAPPVMRDFLRAVEDVTARMGYEGDVLANVLAAIRNRIGSLCEGPLGTVFNLGCTYPTAEQLTNGYTVISMAGLTEAETAILVLFLEKMIREYLQSLPVSPDAIRFCSSIDELHVVAGTGDESPQAQETSNPKAVAAHFLYRNQVECRKWKWFHLYADQSPSRVSPAIMHLTGTKLGFLAPYDQDRRTLVDAMLLGDVEYEHLARLAPGQAYFLTPGYHRARLIRTVNLHERMDLSDIPMLEDLPGLFAGQPWYVEAQAEVRGCALERLSEEVGRFAGDLAALGARAAALRASYDEAVRRGEDVAGSRREAGALKAALVERIEEFRQGPYDHFLGPALPAESGALFEHQRALEGQFEEVLHPAATGVIRVLETMFDGTCGG